MGRRLDNDGGVRGGRLRELEFNRLLRNPRLRKPWCLVVGPVSGYCTTEIVAGHLKSEQLSAFHNVV